MTADPSLVTARTTENCVGAGRDAIRCSASSAARASAAKCTWKGIQCGTTGVKTTDVNVQRCFLCNGIRWHQSATKRGTNATQVSQEIDHINTSPPRPLLTHRRLELLVSRPGVRILGGNHRGGPRIPARLVDNLAVDNLAQASQAGQSAALARLAFPFAWRTHAVVDGVDVANLAVAVVIRGIINIPRFRFCTGGKGGWR